MGLIFKQILTDGIAQISYLIGDDTEKSAAVIDPRPDVEIYVDMARENELAITHIFETHIHADFMSGARELAARVGTAKIYCSHEGGAESEYGFDHEGVSDGDRFEIGSTVITARHAPSHTPEHMAYLAAAKEHPLSPWGVFTGDSLFVGSAGRPDLLGKGKEDELAEAMFRTLYEFYLELDHEVIIYPCHGAGSACGADIGDRPNSTIGYERRFNPFLQFEGRDEFKRSVLEGAPPEPSHYKRLKKINAEGPEIIWSLPRIRGLPPSAFKQAIESGENTLVDTRHMLAFGGGHIEGAINLGARAELSVWAGDQLDPERPILLVLDSDTDLDRVVPLLLRTGYTKYAGYLAGGMTAWDNAGLPIRTLPQMSVHQVNEQNDDLQILDVRSPGEWEGGHLPKARHQYVGDFHNGAPVLDELDKNAPLAVYCNSGYRASLASSLLQARGFEDVRNVPGSWEAWTSAGYAIDEG